MCANQTRSRATQFVKSLPVLEELGSDGFGLLSGEEAIQVWLGLEIQKTVTTDQILVKVDEFENYSWQMYGLKIPSHK